MGLANYYAAYIPNFATMAAPITNLLQSAQAFVWGPEAQAAFERIKTALASAPCLLLPRFDLPFSVVTNTSAIGVGAVLQQDVGLGP